MDAFKDVSASLGDVCSENTNASKQMYNHARFEVFTAMTIKNDVFLDVTQCGSCKNRRFGGT
jgi:hypothetical protein